ncbi:MAG TPA: hypothetical protein VNT30_09425 [Stellaceae bacterium]|nr:hypothetical protein [Stellaceae bacterium]
MAGDQIQRRGGIATQVAAFTPASREIIIDTTNNRAVIGDGVKAGGWPAARLDEASDGTPSYAVDTGAANAYVITLVPVPIGAPASLRTGFGCRVRFSVANSGAATIAVNGFSVPLVRRDGSAVRSGDINTTDIFELRYDGANMHVGGLVYSDIASGTGGLNWRNRLINGDMRVDQANGGASISLATGRSYILDQWALSKPAAPTVLGQRVATVPAGQGFINALMYSVTNGGVSGSSESAQIDQPIEGLDIADLNWGSAAAQSISISFWMRSPLTGLHAVSVRNGGTTRSYVGTVNIVAANTFQYCTLSVPGDQAGTWATDTTTGLYLGFDMGSGSNFNTTAGAWTAGNYLRTAGSANIVNTTGSIVYLTGVQLEAGSTTTVFERNAYGEELRRCQRYFEWLPFNIYFTSPSSNAGFGITLIYKATKRAIPTIGSQAADPALAQGNSNINTPSFAYVGTEGCFQYVQSNTAGVAQYEGWRAPASARL